MKIRTDFNKNLSDNRNQEENQSIVRNKVLESYQDMKAGKGRDYKDFFDELEQKYKI